MTSSVIRLMAFCSNCGSELGSAARACPECGHPTTLPSAPKKGSRRLLGLSLLLGGLVLLVIVIVLAASDPESNRPAVQTQAPAGLFAGRPDAQREDQERNTGESAAIDGLEGTVKTASFQQSLSDFEDAGYLVADVAYANHSGGTKPYNILDWKLQRPNGTVENTWQSGSAFAGEQIGSGDLVSGGNLDGKVIFKVGDQKGDFYVIWKPGAFDAARGVWKVTL